MRYLLLPPRLLIATMVSLTVLILSEIYYRATEIFESDSPKASQILAHVLTTKGQTLRRHKQGELWEVLTNGDTLLLGDTLRTPDDGYLKIKWVDTDKEVEIDPGSLVSLDPKSSDLGLLLALSGSTHSPLKLRKTEAIQFKSWKTQSQSLINIIQPKSEDVFYVYPNQKRSFSIQWVKLDPSYSMRVFVGESPDGLKPFTGSNDHSSSAQVDLKPGDLFWKMAVYNQDRELVEETPIFKTRIENRLPPLVVEPQSGAILKSKIGDPILIKWHSNPYILSTRIEIFRDSQLLKGILSETPTESQIAFRAPEPGVYYWQLVAKTKDDGNELKSPVYSFTIRQKNQAPGQLSWSKDLPDTQYYIGETPILNLKWEGKGVAGPATIFKVSLSSYKSREWDLDGELIKSTNLLRKMPKPGRYRAQIEAFDQDMELISRSPARTFDVLPEPLLPSVELTSHSGNRIESDSEGNIQLSWKPLPFASGYQIRLVSINIESDQVFESFDPQYQLNDLMPGSYRLSIIAIDRYKRPGADGISYHLEVPEPEFLISPKIKKWEVE